MVRLNDPNYMPCHLVITRLAAGEPTRWDSGTSEKSAKTWGRVEQPASALVRSPVCHPQCRYNDLEKSGGG